MELHLFLHRHRRLADGVYRELREAILGGRLRPGDRLPSTRALAEQLSVSRNTVLDAFARLSAEGFLAGNAGAGSRVRAGALPEPLRRPAAAAIRPRPLWDPLALPDEPARAAAYDFQIGVPDPALFPAGEWRRLLARQLRRRPQAGYPDPQGDPAARAAIARHLARSRSVRAAPEEVLITAGAQQALALIGQVLVAPGDCVAVEDPGYPPARRLFQSLGAKLAPVPVDGEGLRVDALPASARLVYVTPSHQFPLGVPMSLARRAALLEWSERSGAAIVEDDYDGELRFDGRPLEPLQDLDRRGRVLYVGTASKVLLPALRIGFLVAPPPLVPALRAAKQLADSHGPPEPQRALAALIDGGGLARHLRRLARVYRERRDRLVEAIARRLGDRVHALPAPAGLHLSILFRDRAADAEVVARRALERGVQVQPLRPYWLRRPRPGLALGYGRIEAARIDEGIRRLAEALPALRPGRRRGSG